MSSLTDNLQVAIDGPAGAGKSTVARETARRLGIKYLDTGAMYRAVTLKIMRSGIALEDRARLQEMLENTAIILTDDGKTLLDGEDVTTEIRSAGVNGMVSPVSAVSLVRRRLVEMQQELAATANGIIMEGRDIASKVMPDARFKFYLDASLEERARRRGLEQKEKGMARPDQEVVAEIKNRDTIDSGREDSPLEIVPGATVIDTTDLSFEAVVEKIVETILAESVG